MLEDPYEYEEQRITVSPYWLLIVALLIPIALVGALWAGKVYADDSVGTHDGSVKYVRHEAQCDDADILAVLLRMGAGDFLATFKKGTLTYGGREWRSCWTEIDGTVYSVDEEGVPFEPIPARSFKKTGVGA